MGLSPLFFQPSLSLSLCHCASLRKKKREKPKLDNANRVRGIYFIKPDDEEFKHIMKNARRKLEIPMLAATPCKLQRDKYRETCRTVEEDKTKYAYEENALKDLLTRIMKITLQEKG